MNLALVIVKAVGGIISHSSSLLADAAHSAADILSDILTLSTITFSLRDPNEKFPLGYGKVETLGGIGVSALLCIFPVPIILFSSLYSSLYPFPVLFCVKLLTDVVLGGVGIGLSSLDALMESLPPNTLPAILEQLIHAGHAHGGHSHSHVAATGADPIALWVSAASIGVKEWLFRASSIPLQCH